jgi:digeranylgeranylglycerophospholipid reductase
MKGIEMVQPPRKYDYDVIVVGAGPAGAAAAYPLAQQGWRVALLERSSHPGHAAVCGGMITLSSVKRFNADSAIEKVMTQELHVLPWGVIENKTEQCTVRREVFDHLVARQAEEAGAELITHMPAVAIRRMPGGEMKVTVRPAQSTPHTLMARGVILADGPRTLARSLGLGFSVRGSTTAFGLAYEISWPGHAMDHYEIFFGQDIARWGYAWVFPYRDRLNIGLGCIQSELARRGNLKADLHHLIDQHPRMADLLRGRPIMRQRGGWIPLRPTRRMVGPSTLVAGDAAGLVHPLLAAGLDNALESGDLAGRVMAEALAANDLSARSLARYQNEWEATPAARFMRLESWIAAVGEPLSHLDGNMLAKAIQLALLGGKLTWAGKFQALGYPILGTPRTRAADPRSAGAHGRSA